MKPFIKQLTRMLDLKTNARIKIVTYLFETLSTNGNVLHITIRELSEELNVCTNTVTFTLKKLEQEEIIERRTGTIMLNSDIWNQWNADSPRDESDSCGLNINIQMDQKRYGSGHPLKQKTTYESREEQREAAFSALAQHMNAESLNKQKSEISEREKAVQQRETACDVREASLIEREKTVRQWEKRVDALLGLNKAEEHPERTYSMI